MEIKSLIKLILIAVALGAGIGALVLNMMGSIEVGSAITLLSIGVVCLAIVNIQEKS
ncbi:MAG TPA: hypothetical protein VF095_09260 [Bacillota bacterium]